MPAHQVQEHAEGSTIEVRAIAGHALAVNRALADALALVHRATYTCEVPAGAAPRALSPEEKLLSAIFGERGEPAAEGDLILPETEVQRGTDLFRHAAVRVQSSHVGVVEASSKDGARVSVTVRWPGPLTVGDGLELDGRSLGLVEAIVDDGAPEPRLYANAISGQTVRVARSRPTAHQQLRARSIGPYEGISKLPATGEIIRLDQLAWLAAHGGDALVSEFATYKTGDRMHGPRLFEALVKLDPVQDGFTASGGTDATPATTSPSDGPAMMLSGLGSLLGRPAPAPPAPPPPPVPSGLFDFFSTPPPTLERLERLAILGRGAFLELARTGRSLAIGLAADGVPAWSRGEVTDDLFSEPLFGPRADYRCACGKHSRMKDRGIVCDQCGVEVLHSKVRRERCAHIALRSTIAPRRFPEERYSYVPVLPPELRPDPDSALNRAYQRVLAGELAAVDEIVDIALGLVVDELCFTQIRCDYSGAAVVRVGERNRASGELLARIAEPLAIGVAEAAGFTTTIKSAQRLLAKQPELRDQLVRRALHDRVLLAGRADRPELHALAFEVGDAPVIELDAATAARIGVTTGDLLSLHLPVSDAGQYEAKQLAPRDVPEARGWVRHVAEATDRDAQLGRLADAARARAVDPCDWIGAAFVIGGYPYRGSPPPPLAIGEPPPAEPAEQTEPPHLDRHVDELELSVRTANALQNAGIATIRDLVQRTDSELLKSGFTRPSLKELKEILVEMGLSLGMRLG